MLIEFSNKDLQLEPGLNVLTDITLVPKLEQFNVIYGWEEFRYRDKGKTNALILNKEMFKNDISFLVFGRDKIKLPKGCKDEPMWGNNLSLEILNNYPDDIDVIIIDKCLYDIGPIMRLLALKVFLTKNIPILIIDTNIDLFMCINEKVNWFVHSQEDLDTYYELIQSFDNQDKFKQIINERNKRFQEGVRNTVQTDRSGKQGSKTPKRKKNSES